MIGRTLIRKKKQTLWDFLVNRGGVFLPYFRFWKMGERCPERAEGVQEEVIPLGQ